MCSVIVYILITINVDRPLYFDIHVCMLLWCGSFHLQLLLMGNWVTTC